ncbi:MAG: hypoxanthine phosphoribosyltransferase [candidate division Zixibacteria bacterium]|nr:hypoxanthine phosphoribosyltransferase [candidate division Zixibacteria bacterium]
MDVLEGKNISPLPFELLLDRKEISRAVLDLGKRITDDYDQKELVIVGVLKGCIIFIADLIRDIKLPIELEFVSASSYRKGATQQEKVKTDGTQELNIIGKHVLLVEGVVDTGKTISTLMKELVKQKPASLEIVTLLDKPGSHRTKLNIKYKGFTIGNNFVIGYGLDNTQKYRNLPFIGKVVDK